MTDQIPTITADDIVTALRGAIEYRGLDYVYSTPSGDCLYRNTDGTPSCVFGVAFDSLGILPPPGGPSIEGLGIGDAMVHLENEGYAHFVTTREQRMGFHDVQGAQDDRRPYDEVLDVLTEHFGEAG